MARVIVRSADESSVFQVINELFDSLALDPAGKRVLVKPNMVRHAEAERAVVTDPCVVKAIVETIRRRGGDPVVGDNPMIPSSEPIPGMAEACGGCLKSIGASSMMKSIGGYEVPISRDFLEADFVINVPKFKTHVLTGMSVCLKNMLGIVPGNAKAKMHARAGHAKGFTRFLVDLYSFRPPDLNIVDAMVGMEGNGPTAGNPRRIGKIIAGPNGVEVDAVCAYMMGFEDPRQIKLLDFAQEKGLGELRIEKIDVVGDLERIEDFDKPSTYTLHLKERKQSAFAVRHENIYQLWEKLGSMNPRCDEEKCIQCGECEEVCPAKAIYLNPYPVIDTEKCICCFCCTEICMSGAMEVPGRKEMEVMSKGFRV